MTSEVASAKAKDDTAKEDPKHKVQGEEAAADPNKVPEPQPGYARPVMIHRAIYGSFERFIA